MADEPEAQLPIEPVAAPPVGAVPPRAAVAAAAPPEPGLLRRYLSKWWKAANWPTTPGTEWYFGGWPKPRCRGNHSFHVALGALYLAICLAPVVHYLFAGDKRNAQETVKWLLLSPPWQGAVWLFITTVGLPLFVWWENLGFNDWITSDQCSAGKPQKKLLTERFNTNSKYMEATWKSVAGLYLVGGLLSFSKIGETKIGDTTKSPPATSAEISALTKAIDSLKEEVGKSNALRRTTETQTSGVSDSSNTGQPQKPKDATITTVPATGTPAPTPAPPATPVPMPPATPAAR